ncbi:MAG TPA: hypothetical protein DEP07_03980, partial [Brevibacillus sp.]|nr:hypothetical protein [Brevibacillus sp.]
PPFFRFSLPFSTSHTVFSLLAAFLPFRTAAFSNPLAAYSAQSQPTLSRIFWLSVMMGQKE